MKNNLQTIKYTIPHQSVCVPPSHTLALLIGCPSYGLFIDGLGGQNRWSITAWLIGNSRESYMHMPVPVFTPHHAEIIAHLKVLRTTPRSSLT
jgi:hypothetical protein